ncbi:MAG: agmatinase [Candidatus Aminicenantes bacterium]|nr:agmatinase [Candidatus Aminicenantes bacterium]
MNDTKNSKPQKKTTYKVALLGIPHDANSSYVRGAAAAPPLIKEALYCETSNLFSESGLDLGRADIFFCAADVKLKNHPGDADYPEIEKTILDLTDRDCLPLCLGGDHAVTFPIVRAIGKKHAKIDVLQFDAHPDLYDCFQDNPFSHACPFARILESGKVNRLVQVGIRTLNEHQRKQAEKFGVEMIEMRHLEDKPVFTFDKPLYISFDLDALDPAFAPGVSHPEPGGLSVRRVLEIMRRISAPFVTGADIVEYNPQRDPTGITAVVAAKLIKEFVPLMLLEG